MTSGAACFRRLKLGFPFNLLALKPVWVSSDNNGPKGLCNIEQWLLRYFQLPGFGPVQWVNDMSPHGAHRSFLDQFVCPCSLQPFFFSATMMNMMMMVAINSAMVVLRMPILLQMLTPSELEVRFKKFSQENSSGKKCGNTPSKKCYRILLWGWFTDRSWVVTYHFHGAFFPRT